MLARRHMLSGAAALLALGGCDAKTRKTLAEASDLAQRLAAIKTRHGGLIGLSALSASAGVGANGQGQLSIDSTERFAHCSTFKWVLAAAVLQGVDRGQFRLDQAVRYGKADLLAYAPVTSQHLAEGRMRLLDLCAAMVELSDNTAANLVLPLIGGPAGLTAFVRAQGDAMTRFDRNEPALNSNIAGDPRDTTTPQAMTGLLRTVFTGMVLKPESLQQLKAWMAACSTGAQRIRAGVPAGWTVADKTGTGDNGAVNDVAVLWPPAKAPVFLSIYTSGGALDGDGRNQVIADLTRLTVDTLGLVGALKS